MQIFDILIQFSCRKNVICDCLLFKYLQFYYNPVMFTGLNKCFQSNNLFFDRALLGLRLRLTNAWSCQSTSTTRSKTEKDTRWCLMGKYVHILLSLAAIHPQPYNQTKVATIRPCCLFCLSVLGVIMGDLIGTQCAFALCWMSAIFTSSCQYNVLLLCLMNSIMACNCSYAYE